MSDNDLGTRFADIVTNLTTLQADGRLGCMPEKSWWTVCTHLLEECDLRGWDLRRLGQAARDGTLIPRSTWPTPPPGGANLRAAIQRASAGWIIKYSKADYLRETIAKGRFRIAPASTYSDPSLNPAVRDDELAISKVLPPSEVCVSIPQTDRRPPLPLPLRGNATYTLKARTNFYVYCLSLSAAPRLFGDFDADACVVIRRPEKVIERLLAAFEQQMPGWHGVAQPVSYVDPFNHLGRPDVYFSKHFRYAYQREFRLVWVPDHTAQILDPVFIEIGPLSDLCELVIL